LISIVQKLWKYFNPSQKKNFFYISVLSVTYVLLETLAMSMILPLISVLIDKKNYFYNLAENISLYFGFQEVLSFVLILTIAVFLIKNFLLVFFFYTLNKYISLFQTETSRKLLSSSFAIDYDKLTRENSSKLIRNISISSLQLSTFVKDFFIFVLNIILILILTLLLLASTKATVPLVLAIFFVSLLTVLISKKYINELGNKFLSFSELWMKKLSNSSRAIKQIKIMKLENFFLNDFIKDNKQYNFVQALRTTLTLVPKSIIETFAILMVCGLIFLSTSNNNLNNQELIVSLAYFGIITSRIIPLLNSTLTIWTNLTFLKPITLDVINSSLFEIKNTKKFLNTSESIQNHFIHQNLFLKNLSYKYPRSEKFIFQNINLKIPLKKIIGVTGPSGSGKSTFLDLICNLLSPAQGSISLDKYLLKDLSSVLHKKIGYASQEIIVLDTTIKENIIFGRDSELNKTSQIKNNIISEVSKLCLIDDFIDLLPLKYETRCGENGALLSGGQKQRISLARTLLLKPQILILDEATNALDEKTEKKIIENLLNENSLHTMFLCTHKKENLEYCDYIIEVKKGSVVIL